ncbi:ABC transporter permease [Oceanispirochaeta crateris]|uniref:ABC transporter permease n=1 Tax=Oceanispirochaeta crateris TaxID=2518645 RepID=A0A5C1QSI8_9SPIO|nr:ABC transporter permease [Oceanispirochaeta crateris]
MDNSRMRSLFNILLKEVGIGVVLLVLVIAFSLGANHFFSVNNVANIFTQISINTVIAVGMTFVILLGGIDLSVGSVLALCSIIAGKILTNPDLSLGSAIVLAILLSVISGMLIGFLNGFISETWKIHSFIVTLGMLNIARGLALQISQSRTIFNFPKVFNDFGTRTYFSVLPAIFIMALSLVILGSVVLRKTVFGRMIFAIGNNEESVRLSGHNVKFYKIMAYTICGGTVGIATIMYMLRMSIASPILGVGFELNAIAAVVIGGTSMSGGKGSLVGTFLGASIMGVLNNGLLLIGMGDFARQIVTGLIIILAVILDTYRTRFSVKLNT